MVVVSVGLEEMTHMTLTPHNQAIKASCRPERRIWCKNPACGQHAMPMDVGEGRYQTPSKFVCMFCESEAYALCTQCKELHHLAGYQ